jgi:hypothetical protein
LKLKLPPNSIIIWISSLLFLFLVPSFDVMCVLLL